MARVFLNRRARARGLQVRTEALVGRVPSRGDWESECAGQEVRLANSPLPEVKEVESDDDKGMLDFAGGDQLGEVRDRHQAGGQVFAVVELDRVQAVAILEHDREAGVAHDGRIGKDPADEARG